jgi:hypothetical protein
MAATTALTAPDRRAARTEQVAPPAAVANGAPTPSPLATSWPAGAPSWDGRYRGTGPPPPYQDQAGRLGIADAPARRGRRLLIPFAVLVLLVVLAAAGWGIYALNHKPPGPAPVAAPASSPAPSTSPSTTPTPLPPGIGFTAADLQLMSVLPAGYNKANCQHYKPDSDETANLYCTGSASANTQNATYLLFSDLAAMNAHYVSDINTFPIAKCPDGTLPDTYSAHGQSQIVGRTACFTTTDNPPVPAIIWSSEPDLAIGVAYAANPNAGQVLLSWWQQQGAFK